MQKIIVYTNVGLVLLFYDTNGVLVCHDFVLGLVKVLGGHEFVEPDIILNMHE